MKRNPELLAKMKWAIEKYHKDRSDQWLAKQLNVPRERVTKMRQRLGLVKVRWSKDTIEG